MSRAWLLLLACPGALFAQPQSPLSMENAVEAALRTSPELRAIRAAQPVAAAELQAASVLSQPEFRLSMNNLGVDPETLEIRNNIGLRWAPPRPWEFSLKRRVAGEKQRGVEAGVRAAEARLATTVRRAYRRAAVAEEKSKLAAKTVELRQAMLEVARRQVAAGLKEAIEADLAELALADAQAAQRTVDALATAERRKLARLVGADSVVLAPDAAALRPPAALDQAQLTAQALTARAELDQLEYACRQSSAQEAIARNQRYPWVSSIQVSRRFGNLNRGPWGMQVGLELPLFRTQASAETRIAAANTSRCRLEQEALRTRIRHELEDAAKALESAARDLAELDRLASGVARQAVERLETALAAGRADRLELLTAQTRQLAIRDRYLDRRLDFTLLEEQLELALGTARP